MKERYSLVRVTAERYQWVGKREKGVVLDEFVQAIVYRWTYASYLLSRNERRIEVGAKRGLIRDMRKHLRR